jgi:hypothetical protein
MGLVWWVSNYIPLLLLDSNLDANIRADVRVHHEKNLILIDTQTD